MKTKTCTKCGKTKELKEFSKHPTSKLGIRPDCKICRAKESRKFYKENKKKIQTQHKKWIKENKELIRIQQRKYRKNNKKNLSKLRSIYRLKRYNEDIEYKLKNNLRSRLTSALNGTAKISTTLKLLDCTIEELKNHLQSQFKKGMNWNNHNIHGWHIDHIKPCSKFDLSKSDEQYKCFHYSNLQPLWAEENWKK